MARISLTLVQTFYQVASHGSFSGAARELNLSYQSAANHVRRLEQILRDKLIESEQGAKRIVLTPRGRALYNLLHPELDIMLERLTRLIENQRSSLRIGMPQAIFYYLFPQVLTTFRAEHPDIEIAAYERDTVLGELVKNGSLDICLSERYFGDPVVPQRLLGSYRLSLVYPAAWGPSDGRSSRMNRDRRCAISPSISSVATGPPPSRSFPPPAVRASSDVSRKVSASPSSLPGACSITTTTWSASSWSTFPR
jgi:molybdate transport repressor ModE-like protein